MANLRKTAKVTENKTEKKDELEVKTTSNPKVVKTEKTEKEKETKTANEDPIAINGTTITKSQLEDLKKKYKKIFLTNYIGKVFVWHRINRSVFAEICNATKDIKDDDELIDAREKMFCERAIVYPSLEEVKADIDVDIIYDTLSQEIMYRSGFHRPSTKEI